MTYLTVDELCVLHEIVLRRSGGLSGIRDVGGLKSAAAQPQMSFGGQDLYPTLADKAAALGYSLIMNHPFVDGNKRIGHAAIEAFLIANGYELQASVNEQEALILAVAAGQTTREAFAAWVQSHCQPCPTP